MFDKIIESEVNSNIVALLKVMLIEIALYSKIKE
jgi:hypothetical protein